MTKGGDAKLLHLVRKYYKDDIRDAEDLLTCICTNHREYQRRNPSKLKTAISAILQEEEYERAALEQDERSGAASLNASLCSRYSQLPETQEESFTPNNDQHDEDNKNNKKKPRTAEQEASRKRRKVRRALLSETAATATSCDFRMENRPTERFTDLGGLTELIETIRQLVITPLRRPELYRHLGVEPPRGILLRGPPGTGKTHLANAIAGELDIPFFKISAPELVSGMSGESESRIRDVFAAASAAAPSLMFLDEIDAVAPKRDGDSSRGMEKRMVAQLLTCLDSLKPANNRNQCAVMVLAATNRPDALDPALRRAGRFDKELLLGVPEESARRSMLQTMTSGMRAGTLDFSVLAKRTPGFVGADLKSLAKEAANIAIQRIVQNLGNNDNDDLTAIPAPPMTEEQLQPLSITMDDFLAAIPLVQPSSKREGFATVPGVTWEDIGALQPIREELHSSVLEPIRNPDKFHQLGLPLPAGVLLFGPPGCGKTLLAKAIANESGANFISVKGPELLDKYVGESEKAVRVVFERARSSSPCIIFFDELDSLVPRRGSDRGGGGVSERVVNQLLTEMDGLNSRRSVFVMAATNRPELIDPAMLRPGRLDKLLYVPLPTAPERVSILRALAAKISLADDVDLEAIGTSNRAEGYSGADCAALLREAGLAVMKENSRDASVPLCITTKHFELAFNAVIPSVSKKDQARYDRMRDKMAKARTRDATTLLDETITPENLESSPELQ